MKAAGGGAIICMSSISWMAGMGGMPLYTASKSAVIGLVRSLARDFGHYNIRVNSIAPGWIMTKRQLELWLTPEADAMREERQALKRRLYARGHRQADAVPRLRGFQRHHRPELCGRWWLGLDARSSHSLKHRGSKLQTPADIKDIVRPPRHLCDALARNRHRDRQQRAQPHGHPRPAYPRPAAAPVRLLGGRAGADAAMHAEARGPLRRR